LVETMPEFLMECEELQEECCGRWSSYAGKVLRMSLCEIASLSWLNIRITVVRNVAFSSERLFEVRTDPV
jgi:hypothetical protein